MAPDDRPEPGDDEAALLRFLAQFGIEPGPDGRLEIEQLMGRMQGMMSAFTSQMASFGKSDSESGMNWTWVKFVAFKYSTSSFASSRYVSERLPSSGLRRHEPRCIS